MAVIKVLPAAQGSQTFFDFISFLEGLESFRSTNCDMDCLAERMGAVQHPVILVFINADYIHLQGVPQKMSFSDFLALADVFLGF